MRFDKGDFSSSTGQTKSIFDNPYWTNGQSYGTAALSGVSAAAAIPPAEGRFDIDPNAGYKGSISGLSQGGVVGAIAGGIGAQIGTFGRVNKNLKSLNTAVNGSLDNGYGVDYNSGAFSQANQDLRDLQSGKNSINKSWDPATRVFSGLFGTKKKLNRASGQITANVQQAQKDFNEANTMYQRQALARRSYEDQINNVYGIPGGYY